MRTIEDQWVLYYLIMVLKTLKVQVVVCPALHHHLSHHHSHLVCCFGAVKTGDRIAQLILERIVTPEVEAVQELSSTVRGAGGYGSTGVGA